MTLSHHIIHDTDRDGFGSAALLVASLGPECCRLYPVSDKDINPLLIEIEAHTGDTLWVLDIPTPQTWKELPILPGAQINWVDHHPVRAVDHPPGNVCLYLPIDNRPVTTMHLLVQFGLIANVPEPMTFIRSLCVPQFETAWTRVFDGLAKGWVELENTNRLPRLLAQAPVEEAPPTELLHLEQRVIDARNEVESIVDQIVPELHPLAVVVRIDDAHGHQLKHFGLLAQRKFDRPVSIVVHRNRTIYCGRNTSADLNFDFLAYFASRGIETKGHPYVAFAHLSPEQTDVELSALLTELEEAHLQRDHLEKVIDWANRIERDLHDLIRRRDLPVHFRPGASGVSMVGLTPERPQRGKSGITNLGKLRDNFEELFETYCIRIKQGRDTPEKQLQSFLIRSAICDTPDRSLIQLNDASIDTGNPVKFRFAVDEIPLPYKGGKIVCDILAVRETPNGFVPVVIELKSAREMKRLIEQVTGYATLIQRHLDLFQKLFSIVLRDSIVLNGPCEKWIIWPSTGSDNDPREDEFARDGIRITGYEEFEGGFKFRV